MSPALAGRFFATEPPGKPWLQFFFVFWITFSSCSQNFISLSLGKGERKPLRQSPTWLSTSRAEKPLVGDVLSPGWKYLWFLNGEMTGWISLDTNSDYFKYLTNILKLFHQEKASLLGQDRTRSRSPSSIWRQTSATFMLGERQGVYLCYSQIKIWREECCSQAFRETNSLRRTMQIMECSLLHQRAQGSVSS